MDGAADAKLAWAEARVGRDGDDYLDLLADVAERTLARAVILEHLDERAAARAHRDTVEMLCALIDVRRRAAGLSTSADELT